MAVLTLLLTGCGEAAHGTTASLTSKPARYAAPSAAGTRSDSAAGSETSRPRPRLTERSLKTAPTFRFQAVKLTPTLRRQLSRTSWHPGCPVALGKLRYLRISYWGFDRRGHLGEIVVNASVVHGLRRAFGALFAARFPIRRMRLVDRYGGSDYASIRADNTSAFNCRDATGSSTWSQHAYGLAIDVNPIENPYVYANGTTTHPASDPYLNRSNVRPGMAVPGGTLVRAFTAIGWGWGGRWPPPTDYQHFSVNGR
jgi:D-alanyl-D-alanine carboxypeptidase